MKEQHKISRKERKQKRIAHARKVKTIKRNGQSIQVRRYFDDGLLQSYAKCSGVYNSVYCRY